MDGGTEPIEDHELLYRRVPASTSWYNRETRLLSPEAFAPHRNDLTGVSVYRDKYKSVEEAARGRPGKSYYVAVLQAGDLRQNGIIVVPRPDLDQCDRGHAELPDLNSGNRKDDKTLERQRLLAEVLCLRVEGPFAPGNLVD